MSTYWGYVCRSHTPPLASDHWLNHGEEVLRALATQRDLTDLVDALDKHGMSLTISGAGGAVEWLSQHRDCDIALHNEYGDTEELVTTAILRERQVQPETPASDNPGLS